MRERFLEIALANPVVATIVDRAPKLGLPEWYLTAGGLFQTVWNHIDGRDLGAGIKDYDLFYFDAGDLSYDAEDRVIRSAAELFADVDADVEVRNEARVHLCTSSISGFPAFRSPVAATLSTTSLPQLAVSGSPRDRMGPWTCMPRMDTTIFST